MGIFQSEENVIINGIDIAATFNTDGGYFVVQNVSGRSMGNIELNTTTIPGRRGSIYRGRDIKERIITIDFALKAKTYADLRKRLEQLNILLMAKTFNEIKFLDEMDRTYYGTVENMQEAEEDSRIHKGVITIICTDPLKYANQQTKSFIGGEVTVQNGGAVPMDPLVEFEVLSDITYLDIFTGDDYMRIGRATEDGLPPIQPKTTILNDDAGSVNTWTTSTTAEENAMKGTVSSNGFSISPSSYGTGTGWHGPGIQQVLSASVQDFEVQARFIARQPSAVAMGKIVIELLDATGKIVGRMVMFKNKAGSQGNTATLRAGDATSNTVLISTAGDRGVEWKQFDGIMRISRRGNVWDAHVAQVNYTTGQHHSRANGRYTDAGNKYTAPVTQVRVHFGQLNAVQPLSVFLHDIQVYRLNDVSVDRVPVIATTGDIITFDHANSVVMINGEPRNDLKDFGGNYFGIPKGVTTILAEPNEKISGTIKYREGYL